MKLILILLAVFLVAGLAFAVISVLIGLAVTGWIAVVSGLVFYMLVSLLTQSQLLGIVGAVVGPVMVLFLIARRHRSGESFAG